MTILIYLFFGFHNKFVWVLLTNVFIVSHLIISIFVWFDPLHIFAALAFILSPSHSLFSLFRRTSSPLFLLLSIQSNIVGDSKARAVVLLLNEIFVWFDPLNISGALTFILHNYCSYFCQFNRPLCVTARCSVISYS